MFCREREWERISLLIQSSKSSDISIEELNKPEENEETDAAVEPEVESEPVKEEAVVEKEDVAEKSEEKGAAIEEESG